MPGVDWGTSRLVMTGFRALSVGHLPVPFWAQYYGPPSNARCVTVVAMISLLKNKQPLPLRLGDGAEATRANELRALWDCLFR